MSAPVITVQPTSQETTVGGTATFTITATSDHGSILYIWSLNGNFAGTNSPSYTTAAATAADDGSLISCEVINLDGTATSNTVMLSVAPAYIIQKAVHINTTGGNTATATFPNALKENSVLIVGIVATDSGGAVGSDGDGSGYVTLTDTLHHSFTFARQVKVVGDRTHNTTLLTGFLVATTFAQSMPAGSNAVTFTFTPISSAGNCQVGLVAYELAATLNSSQDNCFSADASAVFPVAYNLPGSLTWTGCPYGIWMFVIGACFAGGSPITVGTHGSDGGTGGSGWVLDGSGVFGNSAVAFQTQHTAVTSYVSDVSTLTQFGSSPASGISSAAQGLAFALTAPFGVPSGGGNGGGGSSSGIFLGSVYQVNSVPALTHSTATQLPNPFLGTCSVVSVAPSGVPNPVLGSVVIGSVPQGVPNPTEGEIVILAGSPPAGTPFLGTVAED